MDEEVCGMMEYARISPGLKHIAAAFMMPIVSQIAEIEGAMARGKSLATSCGHPEWENVCCCCGEKEIPIFQRECEDCQREKLLGIVRDANVIWPKF